MAKKKSQPKTDPLILKYVPAEFVSALRNQPDDLTTRLVIADWLQERDEPKQEAAWRWFAATGKSPVAMTNAICVKVDKELGHPGYTAYLLAGNHGKWRWLGVGWRRTSFAPAALDFVRPDLEGHTLSDDPVVLIAALIAAKMRADASVASKKRGGGLDPSAVARFEELIPGGESRLKPAVGFYGDDTPDQYLLTLNETFAAIRRQGGRGVEIHFSGGHDSGGVDGIWIWPTDGTPARDLPDQGIQTQYDPTTRAWVLSHPPTALECLVATVTAPVYASFGSFDGEPYVDGALVWDADEGFVAFSGTTSTTEYTAPDDEDHEDDGEEIVSDLDEEVQFVANVNWEK